ncbi:MAG: alkaline phosphatase [Cyanobacteria bacterium P01_F01_bin.42]
MLLLCLGITAAQATGHLLPQSSDSYYIEAQTALQERLAYQPITNRAKNVILFVADGQGVSSITAARIYAGQKVGNTGEEHYLALETFANFPHLALSKTYNDNAQTPDSAGTMSAMMTGVKTKAGVLSISKDVLRGDCVAALNGELPTAIEMAEKIGMSTGVISTARITHATPAAGYAHAADRNYEDDSRLTPEQKAAGCRDIAAQLLDTPCGNGLEVALGGGRRHFIPQTLADPEDRNRTGRRTDGRNLTQEWLDKYQKSAYVWNRADFESVNPFKIDHLLGLFEQSHMEFEADRYKDAGGEPSLEEMTEKAIQILSKNPKGFVLAVESGRVDHAHHAGNAARALEDSLAFDAAVAKAVEMTDPEETLTIVTADHSHTLSLAGYAQRGNPILGLVRGLDASGLPSKDPVLANDGLPYTAIGYINGPGALPKRADLTKVDTTDIDYIQQALIPLNSETHSAEDVAIYARGPWAHLFSGTVEQNYIFHVIDYAAKLTERYGEH